MEYSYRFPIGDWSEDGHRQCEFYEVKSNKSRAALAQAHRKCIRVFGFTPDALCRGYANNMFTEVQRISLAANLRDRALAKEVEEYTPQNVVDAYLLLEIWLEMLKTVLPDFRYEIAPRSTLFVGGVRVPGGYVHISCPGYGLWIG